MTAGHFERGVPFSLSCLSSAKNPWIYGNSVHGYCNTGEVSCFDMMYGPVMYRTGVIGMCQYTYSSTTRVLVPVFEQDDVPVHVTRVLECTMEYRYSWVCVCRYLL